MGKKKKKVPRYMREEPEDKMVVYDRNSAKPTNAPKEDLERKPCSQHPTLSGKRRPINHCEECWVYYIYMARMRVKK